MSNNEGFDVAIGASRSVLRFLGIWPDPKRKATNWLSRYYFVVPAFVMFYFVNIPQTVRVTKVWGDLNDVLDVLTTSDIPIGIALFKMLGLWYNRDGTLVISMAEDWQRTKTNSELKTMWKNAKLSRLISIIIISLAEGTIVAQFAMVIFFSISESKRQDLEGYNGTMKFRPLYMQANFFYDVQPTPYYEITWLFQCSSTIFAASAFSAVDAFFAVLVLHLCGQLRNMRESLKHLPDEAASEGNEFFADSLAMIVKRHEYLYTFSNSIEDAFNLMFLVQMVFSAMVLCLQGYQLVLLTTSGTGIPLFELIFMIYFTLCFMFSLFVYCYVADVLRSESMAVGDATYESNWYNLPQINNKVFILILMRAKQPFKITAGKVAEFSLELYCSILKSSGSYLSLLLAMKDRIN